MRSCQAGHRCSADARAALRCGGQRSGAIGRGPRTGAAAALLLAWLLLAAGAPRPAAAQDGASVHTVFVSDCSAASDWRALALAFSHRDTSQPGPLTRITTCSHDQSAAQSDEAKELTENLHAAPEGAGLARGVADWLRHATPDEEWVLVVPPDAMFHRRLEVGELNLTGPGRARGGRLDGLAGVGNALAERHVGELAPRQDGDAGPRGRRADQVGGFYLVHRADLKRVAPLWAKYAEALRDDKEVGGHPMGREGGGGGHAPGPGGGRQAAQVEVSAGIKTGVVARLSGQQGERAEQGRPRVAPVATSASAPGPASLRCLLRPPSPPTHTRSLATVPGGEGRGRCAHCAPWRRQVVRGPVWLRLCRRQERRLAHLGCREPMAPRRAAARCGGRSAGGAWRPTRGGGARPLAR